MTWKPSHADLALAIAVAYCLGSVPFALFAARRWGARDLRRIGSGNLGAANVARASGVTAGVLVALLDIAKGSLSVLLARALSDQATAPALAGAAAIVGHVYPVWLRFRGGKGVATTCGVFAVLTPLAVPPALGIFVLTVWITKYVSLGSVLASLCLPPIAYFFGGSAPVVAAACTACALIVFRHRSNLLRVLSGGELRLGATEAEYGTEPGYGAEPH
jgi:glycerol-3-phosphate acyltransferase PlsY